MRILVDTNVLLWALVAPERLSARAQRLLSDPENVIVVSLVTAWELALKAQKLRLPLPLRDFLERGMRGLGAVWLPIELSHLLGTMELPPIHGDPFDRLLLAQAAHESLPLISADGVLGRYPVPVVW